MLIFDYNFIRIFESQCMRKNVEDSTLPFNIIMCIPTEKLFLA